MARFLKPLVRSGGYYPSRRWTPLVYPGGYTTANGGEEPAPPPIEKTITGNPIHILDALAKPVQALSIALEPVQDLNGYDNPWPAGGGKNKFNGTFLQGYWAYADGTWVNSPNWITTEKIPCKASTSYTVSADAKITRWQGFVWYDSNGDFISTDNLNSNVNIGLTKTSPSNAAYLIFNIAGYPGSNDTIAPSDVTHFQLEEGSSSTAYAPYSNICPISGWTGANVTRTGKNLFDGTFIANTMIVDSTGEYYANAYHKCSNRILAKENTAYTLSGTDLHKRTGTETNAANVTIAYYKVDGTYIRREAPDTSTNTYKTVTTPANTAFVIFQVGGQATNVMLEESATETTYEPYSSDTYSITFPSEAGTVYGGTLDVVSGLLTVTDKCTTTTWGAMNNPVDRGNGIQSRVLDLPYLPKNRDGTKGNSNTNITAQYAYSTSGNIHFYLRGSNNAGRLNLFLPSSTTADTPIQIFYELATPQTYQLTPTEVTLLLGENNIWSDGEMTLTYLADGNASDEEALNILLGGRYVNNHSEDEPTDREALNIVLGGNER